MEPPCPLISWVNPFPGRFINRTTFFCNAWIAWMRLLPAVWSKTILSFLYFHCLFPLLARETSSGNCSIYKSTREMVDSNGLYGRWRLHLMGSCPSWFYFGPKWLSVAIFSQSCKNGFSSLYCWRFPWPWYELQPVSGEPMKMLEIWHL